MLSPEAKKCVGKNILLIIRTKHVCILPAHSNKTYINTYYANCWELNNTESKR